MWLGLCPVLVAQHTVAAPFCAHLQKKVLYRDLKLTELLQKEHRTMENFLTLSHRHLKLPS